MDIIKHKKGIQSLVEIIAEKNEKIEELKNIIKEKDNKISTAKEVYKVWNDRLIKVEIENERLKKDLDNYKRIFKALLLLDGGIIPSND